MGLFKTSSSVSAAEARVRYAQEQVNRCEAHLNAMKLTRETAKKNGNYKNSAKNYRNGDKVGTVHDANVWSAETQLKRAKERLAEAKRELAEEKKKR